MMSNIKVGDKVRFLNSTGGGVVRSFKGKDQVLVEDEDGFEVPVLIRECVVVGDSEMQVHSSRRSPLPSVTQAAVPQPKKPEPQPEVEKVTETIEGERLNIYLAYLPIEPAKVIQGNGYETYFINDSNYSLIDCNAGTIKVERLGTYLRTTDRFQKRQTLFIEECHFGRTPSRYGQILQTTLLHGK